MTVIDNLTTVVSLDVTPFIAGAKKATEALDGINRSIDSVKALVLPGVAGIAGAFGASKALDAFSSYKETDSSGMEMEARGAKEYRDAITAAEEAVTHLAAVVGQALAPAATFAAEAFTQIVGVVENITAKTLEFYTNAIGVIGDIVGSWLAGFGTVGDIWESIVSALDTGFSYAAALANNWKDVLNVAWLSAELGAVTFANQVVHFVTEVIPTSLSWFASNWADVFKTIYDYTTTIFNNLGKNIGEFFFEVYDLMTGGTYDFKWTNLEKGFESSLKSLPAIAAREIGPLEKSIQDQLNAAIGTTGSNIKRDVTANAGSFSAGLKAFTATAKDFFTTSKAGGNLGLVPVGGGAASSDKFVGALQFGSKEAYSAIIKATNGGNDYQQRQLGLLGKIADNTGKAPKKANIN